ncbi:aromatic acid exporter family protein [Bacillus sp. HMF5848]|uniref:aromatic acid exporter family protein n=1 Tax=Bacillus sp. HMF5848 TaxID=2495421 RepID=UPI000F78D595|nr:aromatic acid exporter family protein [Bacillus sp. HMF5848]RSK27770.1 aromatic acid exporter family protein [Bacillus sp. HMF5848]
MFKIGYRTIKTAIGAALAIYIASLLQLDNFTSAGILTILCIGVTRKRSLMSSWTRFLTCMIAIVFTFVFFNVLGYTPLAIGMLLLFFIPTTVQFKLSEGIVTSTVIIMHMYAAKTFAWSFILNELAIIVIGIGVALVMNLYMPSMERDLKKLQQQLENNFKLIFTEMVSFLRDGKSDWVGSEITETDELLQKAKSMALLEVENNVLRDEDTYYYYFKMREKQFDSMMRMLPMITTIQSTYEQGKMIADFIEEVSDFIHPGNTANEFLTQLHELQDSFKNMPLPKTRDEFETRANLFQFLKEMEDYLLIKRRFHPNVLDKKAKRKLKEKSA